MENTGLYLAQNCPDHAGYRITSFQIIEGLLDLNTDKFSMFVHLKKLSCFRSGAK
jgi:ribosomal protein RSM22 (predicted rRNA methylase)